jgi:hypothetical protein
LTIHRLTSNPIAQARGQRRQAAEIHAGSARGQSCANNDIIDLPGLEAAAIDCMADCVRHEGRRFYIVERAPKCPADSGARGRYDDNVLHV